MKVVKFMYGKSARYNAQLAMNNVVKHKHFDMVTYLYSIGQRCTKYAIKVAIKRKHTKFVAFSVPFLPIE
jgi:hypothetical protein